jgi:hypothetical protein
MPVTGELAILPKRKQLVRRREWPEEAAPALGLAAIAGVVPMDGAAPRHRLS